MSVNLEEINSELDSILKRMTAYKNENFCSLRDKELLRDITEGARYIHMGLLKVGKIVKVNQENSNV